MADSENRTESLWSKQRSYKYEITSPKRLSLHLGVVISFQFFVIPPKLYDPLRCSVFNQTPCWAWSNTEQKNNRSFSQNRNCHSYQSSASYTERNNVRSCYPFRDLMTVVIFFVILFPLIR